MVWLSPGERPDLGGKEEDDNRYLVIYSRLDNQVNSKLFHKSPAYKTVQAGVRSVSLSSAAVVTLSYRNLTGP